MARAPEFEVETRSRYFFVSRKFYGVYGVMAAGGGRCLFLIFQLFRTQFAFTFGH